MPGKESIVAPWANEITDKAILTIKWLKDKELQDKLLDILLVTDKKKFSNNEIKKGEKMVKDIKEMQMNFKRIQDLPRYKDDPAFPKTLEAWLRSYIFALPEDPEEEHMPEDIIRCRRASKILWAQLTEKQKKTIINAHKEWEATFVPYGDKRRYLDIYKEKKRLLLQDFTPRQARKLMDYWVCGKRDVLGAVMAIWWVIPYGLSFLLHNPEMEKSGIIALIWMIILYAQSEKKSAKNEESEM